jgi:hypothetical protein
LSRCLDARVDPSLRTQTTSLAVERKKPVRPSVPPEAQTATGTKLLISMLLSSASSGDYRFASGAVLFISPFPSSLSITLNSACPGRLRGPLFDPSLSSIASYNRNNPPSRSTLGWTGQSSAILFRRRERSTPSQPLHLSSSPEVSLKSWDAMTGPYWL